MNDNSSPTSQTLTDLAERISKISLCLNSKPILEAKNARLHRSNNQQKQEKVKLSFGLDWTQYKNLETQKWFKFEPTIRGKMSRGEFLTNYDVEITLLLDPDLIEVFTHLQDESETLSLTWEKLSQENPAHPLFDAENWLLLSADQQHSQGKTGYRTVWDYLNWHGIASESDFDQGILDSIVHFLQDHITAELQEDGVQDEQSIQIATHLIELLGKLNPDLLSSDRTVSDRLVTDIVKLFQEPLRQSLSTQLEQALTDEQIAIPESPLLEATIRFFRQEAWSFTQIDNQPLLYLEFQGENGQWNCFAFVQEERGQIVFYSVLGEKVPEEKRQLMAEFICHLNYGLPVGNFELNFGDGELRCKTSLEAKGISINSILIKPLVYNNLLLMNQYITGFQRLIHTDTFLQDILAQVEAVG